MIFAALALAAALDFAAPPPPNLGLLKVAGAAVSEPGALPGPALKAERTPNLYHQPSYCRSVVEREVSRQNTALHGHASLAQYAVDRSLDGCAVPTPVGYHPSYLLDGAAHPVAPKREDAPSVGH